MQPSFIIRVKVRKMSELRWNLEPQFQRFQVTQMIYNSNKGLFRGPEITASLLIWLSPSFLHHISSINFQLQLPANFRGGSMLAAEPNDLWCSTATHFSNCKLLGGWGFRGKGSWVSNRLQWVVGGVWHDKVTSSHGIRSGTSILRFLCLWASYSNPSDQDILFQQLLQAGQQIDTSMLGNPDNQRRNPGSRLMAYQNSYLFIYFDFNDDFPSDL